MTTTGTPGWVYSFGPTDPSGIEPVAGLVQGSDGNFYGTTEYGGTPSNSSEGGTVVQITPFGALTTLYDFCSQIGCTDGNRLTATLVACRSGS